MNNPIRSGRSDSDFVDTVSFTSYKVILGFLRSFFKSLNVILGHSLGHKFVFTVPFILSLQGFNSNNWLPAISKSILELIRMFLKTAGKINSAKRNCASLG